MKAVFADTFYWIAFTNAQDAAHEKAREFTLAAKPGAIYTTEEVLTEYLNYFAGWGSAPAAQPRSQALAEPRAEFFGLAAERDKNKAELTMEGLLNRLFATFELSPRLPFRVVGEQIYGSFVFDTHVC